MRGPATTPLQTQDPRPTEIEIQQIRQSKTGTRLGSFNFRTVTLSRERNQNNYQDYDINGYRKDRRAEVKSNNYFSQDRENSLPEKKPSNAGGGKKPEWRNVYGKGTSQPADGAVNAFQWSE